LTNRPLLRKRDIWIFAGLIVFAILLHVLIRGAEGAYGQISIDGQAVLTVDLSGDTQFALESKPEIRFAVRDGAIAFTESNCPDKICIRSGFLRHTGQRAACLPNRVSLSVIGGDDEFGVDTIAY
jgi:hypothetical protein